MFEENTSKVVVPFPACDVERGLALRKERHRT